MTPVPENKSRTLIKLISILFWRILNKPSLALSVVGLTGRLFGENIFLPLWFPEIILINKNNLQEMEALGMYEVAPEDFALTEFICVSKQPHQEIIRKGLDEMKKELG